MDDILVNLGLSQYVGEPCRICGRAMTMEELKWGAVYVGYSDNNDSRVAHKLCFSNAKILFGDRIMYLEGEIQRLKNDLERFNRELPEKVRRLIVDLMGPK
ncbi:MAG TPA: hypothetical protein PKD55_01480 [Bellilinea sp.]|nr:hypothetical protein [Bellilinea sp.]